MKALLLGLLLWQGAEVSAGPEPGPKAEPRYMRYERAVVVPAGTGEQACATLDAAVYAHGAEALKDLRLYGGRREVPYAVTVSEAAEAESEHARVFNLGKRDGKVVFDLAMPERPYTEVVLDLSGENFIAAAEVTGSTGAGAVGTALGTFTLFDLTGQHLARSTMLHLAESRFAVLHVAMKVSAVPEPASSVAVTVRGASVPPSREAQTVYTVVAETTAITQRGRRTVARFRLPARVPVERVTFELAPAFTGSFSREVAITARPGEQAGPPETVAGNIERVRLTRAGQEIRQEQRSVPATLGANLQRDAEVEVAVENGDDAPLPLASVRLEMRERRLCFPVAAGAGLKLLYGDAALAAPVYDFARVFSPGERVAPARLGPESLHAGYTSRTDAARSLTERHPEVLWVALLGVVCVLAVVATHSAKRVGR